MSPGTLSPLWQKITITRTTTSTSTTTPVTTTRTSTSHDEEATEAELEREREYVRRYALSQIRQYPDPALRMKAREVTEFDDFLMQLVERMINLMGDAQGVGLAATQVGILQRLFVFDLEGEGPQAVVNPRLVDPSSEKARPTRRAASRSRGSASRSSARRRSRSRGSTRTERRCTSSSKGSPRASSSTSSTTSTAC